MTEARDPLAAALLRELDACKPLYNATGPAQGGRTFSGWDVPDWLMQRVRAAIRDTPAMTPTADGLRAAVVGLDWEGCGGWGCSDNMAATLDAVLALLEAG